MKVITTTHDAVPLSTLQPGDCYHYADDGKIYMAGRFSAAPDTWKVPIGCIPITRVNDGSVHYEMLTTHVVPVREVTLRA